MANIKSAEKRIRQTEKRTARNKATRTRVKSTRKTLNALLQSKDKEGATAQLNKLASAADRAAKNGVIHKNAASRLKRLYAQRVAALG